MKVFIFLFLLSSASLAQKNSVLGKWKTIDDNTGKEKSILEITERNGKIYGKVIRIFTQSEEEPDPVCDKCSEEDARYKKKIIGMEIIKDMIRHENVYTDGTVLDPEDGKIYRCKIWMEDNELKVRGYWGFFYRTQTWKRAP